MAAAALSTFIGIGTLWIWIISTELYCSIVQGELSPQAGILVPAAVVPAALIYHALLMIAPTMPIGVSALVARDRSSTIPRWLICALLIGLAALASSYLYNHYGYDFFDQDRRPQSEELSFIRYATALLAQCLVFIVGMWIVRRFSVAHLLDG